MGLSQLIEYYARVYPAQEMQESTATEVPGTRKLFGGGGITTEKAKQVLRDADVSEEDIRDFLSSRGRKPGWNSSEDNIILSYARWSDSHGDSAAHGDSSERKVEAPARGGPSRGDSAGPARERSKPPFRLTQREFTLLIHSNPKLEYKTVLKEFFDEVHIKDYSKVPGDFVKQVNALKLTSDASTEDIDQLKSTIGYFKPSVVTEDVQPAKTKKIRAPEKLREGVLKESPEKESVAAGPPGPKVTKSRVKRLPSKKSKPAARTKRGSKPVARNRKLDGGSSEDVHLDTEDGVIRLMV